MVCIAAAVCAFGSGSITSVTSHAAPKLVSEINVALAEADVRLDAVENGGGVVPAGVTLASGKIVVGGAGGTGTAVTVSSDLTLSNTGVATLGFGPTTRYTGTNVFIQAGTLKTNTVTVIQGIIKSWTVAP
jgi:hypothetical protein